MPGFSLLREGVKAVRDAATGSNNETRNNTGYVLRDRRPDFSATPSSSNTNAVATSTNISNVSTNTPTVAASTNSPATVTNVAATASSTNLASTNIATSASSVQNAQKEAQQQQRIASAKNVLSKFVEGGHANATLDQLMSAAQALPEYEAKKNSAGYKAANNVEKRVEKSAENTAHNVGTRMIPGYSIAETLGKGVQKDINAHDKRTQIEKDATKLLNDAGAKGSDESLLHSARAVIVASKVVSGNLTEAEAMGSIKSIKAQAEPQHTVDTSNTAKAIDRTAENTAKKFGGNALRRLF